MKKRILSILLLCCMVLTLLPTAAFAAGEIDEQFTLAPGGTYYFDLSAMGIPGTVNDALPDKTMRYVPFTYAGTVDSYKLTSEMATTEEYAQQSKYAHSLFIADFAVTHEVSWDNLNAKGLIFGKNYTAGGVSYTLRAPSVGSGRIGSAESQRGTPPSNEWDRILDKNDGYIKNWFGMYSWGQDTLSTSASDRAARGYFPPGGWSSAPASHQDAVAGFRPVLEVLTPGSLGSDGLKAVTLDLGGGKLGDESSIQIIVETGSVFTAPASDGLTRPDGNTGNYFMWRDNDGQLYAPGDYVPADVTKLTAQFNLPEQFTLAPGGTYYFDLSAMGIPGTVNDALPDKTMGYVPFTYAGTVDSYKLTSEMATTEEDAEQNQYPHSLFVADYAVTHTISWDDLNTANLIFGKNYASGGVDYTLRAPSVGSNATGLGDSDPGEPQSNEWDTVLNKDSGYIQNWNEMYSWGQDTVSFDASGRAVRGYGSARRWYYYYASYSFPFVGFRPVLEVLNPGTMGSDRLKAVTLDLGGGKLGGSSEAIQIVVKNGESFAAPASEGLTRPDGNTGSYFEWLGSDGELYAPDDNVPADVTKLTAQFVPPEQFNLAPDGTYYFDLSGVSIPGTVNGSLPDSTLHYVPFTYAGTVDAYALTSEMATTDEYAQENNYDHSLFIADYNVTHTVSWDDLNTAGLIFDKDYAAGGVDYTLRAPSEGSDYTGSGDSERGTPQSNEWDRLLDKDDGYIKNWNGLFSCGQDSVSGLSWRRTVRGYYSSRFCGHRHAAGQNPQVGFRPVLEVLNHDTIGPDGLKAVALDLGGGKLGDESSIRIIVKNGSAFTAPSGDGLTRPEGATGNYFKWLGSDGKLYAPGESVSADVTTLTARFVPDTYTVIVTTDTLPDGKTGKAYSHTLTAISTAPITWRIDEGALPAGLRLNEKTGEISGIPTAAGTATFTVKAENSEGSDTRALSITVNNAVEQTPVRYLDADGKERFCTEYTVLESVIIEDFFNSDNKWYDMPAGWYVVEGDVTITPRLDTHGAVNLILTDDCHLTVPWGINVKEGDTFTICAQSTAEASMGKLTACLPEWSDHDKSVWPVAGLSGIGAGVRVWAANDNFHENEGTIIINGGNIHAKGQQGSSAIGGSDYEHNTSYDGDTPGNLRQGGSITINGGIVCTELRTSGGAHLSDSFGIGTCGGNGGSVTINGGTIIAEASSSAISSGRGGSITINGGNVTAHGGINRYENQPLYAIPGNGIGSLEGGSITINGGTVKASSEGDGFGIGGAGVHHTAEMHITINGGTIETTANRNNAAIGDKSKQKSSVTITGGVIHAVGKGSAAGIGSTGDIRITGGEISVFAEGGGAAIGSIGGVDCKSITINGNAIKSISSKDGACIGGAAGGSVGSITISDAELPLLSAEKILIGWDADSPGGKLTIRNCRVESTDELTGRTDGIRVGSNSELVIENSEIKLPHFRSIRVGGNGSIAVRDSDLRTYGIFMDETAQSPNDAKTLKRLEITDSTVLTGDIIGARGGYSSVEEVVIHDSSIRLNDEYTYNYCTIGGGTNGSFGSIDIQNSQIHIPSSGGNTAIGNGWQVYYNRESRIRIANSEVSVRCASLGPAIGAAWDSGSGRINIIIENSTVTAKGGNLRTDGNYVPGIGKNALGRAPEIGIQILNSTVDSFRLTEKGGTDYVYDDLHTKELPGIPAENISICGSTVNGKTIDHSFDEYGKCTLCGKYDLGYCYEHGLLTMDGLTDCVSDGSEKKLTGLSHQTGENETKQLAENMDYTAIYSNNIHPYTLKPDDAGFDPEKAPKVTLYGTGNYCGKAEHYFTISESTAAAPTITTDTLPNGKVGEAYSHTLTADGTTPITWSVSGGALPEGLTLNETTGEISGTPTAEGTAKFTVKAENSAGSDTKELSITITKDAPPSHEHSYGDWSKDGTSHWHECTDTDCPNREESITDKAAHVYTDDTDTTCDVCGYERTVTPPAHEHSYGDWRKDGTSHWHECTDTDCPNREESVTDKAAHVYTDDTDTTCNVCGYERTVTPPSHEHSYGDWRKDGTSHWHECTDTDCPNREESITDKASHVYTDDTDTTCDVCGYERTVTPPSHEHSYGDWRKDGTSHWHECTDIDCPNREESITDKASHVYTDDTDTTCDVCGYERTVTPPAPTEFIVTFDGNGGTPSVGSMTTTDQKLTSLPSASRSGSYSFDGWYTKKSGGTKITTDTVFSANTTVYAHWTYTSGGGGGYNPPVTYYTLRFETGGGSDIPSVRETYNAYIDLTQYVPTWRGHTFIGWYSERGLINKVSGVYLTKDMTVYAGWRVDENPNTGANPFTDVSEKDWFYGDVMFVYENGLMLGTSKTLFSPHGTATRGMMATILWRMEGSPVPKGKNSFTDVEAGKWYADAITWTAENGIFAGYGKDKFGPDDPITREQLAAIFYRYADYKGYDLTVKGNLDKFKDADKITDYAKTAMQWAVGSGLVKGKSGNLLDPQGTATRAEIAAMLHRFIEKYELVQGKAPSGLMGWIDPKRLKSQRPATAAR
ncbi:MAG: S-layer homology domain-containing protein [Oscillospiraceae bacterium]